METWAAFQTFPSVPLQCRKPTTLWKRWKPHALKQIPLVKSSIVGNPLLSERDGNASNNSPSPFFAKLCRKPTTLWKRWKLILLHIIIHVFQNLSETHYSLKEMETFSVVTTIPCFSSSSETHYSLKEMETVIFDEAPSRFRFWSRKPTTLWKRWKHTASGVSNASRHMRRKPTTLWKRWKHGEKNLTVSC